MRLLIIISNLIYVNELRKFLLHPSPIEGLVWVMVSHDVSSLRTFLDVEHFQIFSMKAMRFEKT